tara:strand:+ start:82 stop:735 length:654 start_codon:yes stop_codon:yes gene_type:complete
MAEKGKPTKSFISHLEHREGSVSKSYLDSLGKLTGGVGHLLLEDEKKIYPKGTKIPKDVRERWMAKDSIKAWDAAVEQASDLGVSEHGQFIEALGSVNFQMGTNWMKKFPSAYKALKSGDFKEAIDQLEWVNPRKKEKGASNWKKQTPVRVKDFVEAIKELKKIKDNIAFSAERQAKKKDQSVMGRVINSENDIDFRNFQATDEMKAARERALKKRR